METNYEQISEIISNYHKTGNKNALEEHIREYIIQQRKENISKKVDWKEWIPVAGVVFATRDSFDDKPSILDDHPVSFRYIAYNIYQTAATLSVPVGLAALVLDYAFR